ncbi:MAG: alpha-amylase family glycosyl hydrolase [Ardenticatenia bacterium]|nr:alpha-amylase family glycosyl hydrolase [Ardenticatenia bacterium]
MRRAWGAWLEAHVGGWLRQATLALDLTREERKPTMAGPGPALVYEYDVLRDEPEQFSPDQAWMPQVVILAKNTYVWLDQLSKKYGRPITRLDHIPGEELDTLARWGINGLWLIGVWERSPASKRIKQLCGNPDAEASAYALFDYRVADALGGEDAFWNLRERAWKRGIRLAGDMVPNHMGIDSPWVMDHPEWFIAVDEPPFPAYTFNGPDLSWRADVGIYLEDHYYDQSDAAVVFKRVDRRTGRARYIYHGNDGTNMPWNDTAQLNYLNAHVREAVIHQILQVARLFPIIRFDAAMTLTKRHYRRLWFPEPGAGGAIPSRAEHGMSKAEFDRLMPKEFWREVVERVAAEAPDTLLLAEAFWLLEGYFVRTLGMHRVYNSAFMHMLRDEKNAEYRQLLKNTLAFDPEILKRYVHFMNNPDEETAVVQFGKGDKYFGICTMMVTLPGLPMFGHGQIEGFAEKYGMEYRRAYWDERPDEELVRRHEHEIFPLVRRRALFAGVDHFLLYDLITPEGHVDENVFAYSNRAGHEAALVVYHNAFAQTRGWIHHSVPVMTKAADGTRRLARTTLAHGLGLAAPEEGEQRFCLFRDHVTGLEYIRPWRDLLPSGALRGTERVPVSRLLGLPPGGGRPGHLRRAGATPARRGRALLGSTSAGDRAGARVGRVRQAAGSAHPAPALGGGCIRSASHYVYYVGGTIAPATGEGIPRGG